MIRIQAVLSIVLALISFFVGFGKYEWAIFIFAVFFMFAVETMNSSIEDLADEVTLKHNREIGIIKDLAAGASGLITIGLGILWLIFIFAK